MPLSGANFAIGVWAGTRYTRAKLVGVNGASRRYQVAIPKSATVRLHLDTSLTVVDENGAALATARPSIAIAAAGQAEIVTTLTVP